MRIEHEDLMDVFRFKTRCECCGVSVAGCDPAHIYSRGAGRVDIASNFVGLANLCHTKSHAGHQPNRKRLLEIAAKREGTTPQAITDTVQFIRRIPKGSNEKTILFLMEELDADAKKLATRELTKAGYLHGDQVVGRATESDGNIQF